MPYFDLQTTIFLLLEYISFLYNINELEFHEMYMYVCSCMTLGYSIRFHTIIDKTGWIGAPLAIRAVDQEEKKHYKKQ